MKISKKTLETLLHSKSEVINQDSSKILVKITIITCLAMPSMELILLLSRHYHT